MHLISKYLIIIYFTFLTRTFIKKTKFPNDTSSTPTPILNKNSLNRLTKIPRNLKISYNKNISCMLRHAFNDCNYFFFINNNKKKILKYNIRMKIPKLQNLVACFVAFPIMPQLSIITAS